MYFRCTPIESLHTILLGPYKYLLRHTMAKLSADKKREILARISAFPYSSFTGKIRTNICQYTGSLVGRDFKVWAQMALFIITSYLNEDQVKVWHYLSKVHSCMYICVIICWHCYFLWILILPLTHHPIPLLFAYETTTIQCLQCFSWYM